MKGICEHCGEVELFAFIPLGREGQQLVCYRCLSKRVEEMTLPSSRPETPSTLNRIEQTLDHGRGYITNEDGQWLIDQLKGSSASAEPTGERLRVTLCSCHVVSGGHLSKSANCPLHGSAPQENPR